MGLMVRNVFDFLIRAHCLRKNPQVLMFFGHDR